MKVYEVECRAVITLAAQDMQKAALHGAAAIKDNPHLIYVKAVHEKKCELSGEAPRTLIKRNLTVRLSAPTQKSGKFAGLKIG
jgi:hypothetical protein